MTPPIPATLAVIAKEPRSGHTKTRLCPPCTPAEAAAIADGALRDTLAAVEQVPVGHRVLLLDGAAPTWLDGAFEVRPQAGGGLDERLAAAFSEADGPVLVIAMDTPQVNPTVLTEALRALLADGCDAVLGPADDGGYWALGLRHPDAAAVLGVPMSRADTGTRQLERLAATGRSVHLLPSARDLDTFDDALALAATLPGSHTAAAVGRVAASRAAAHVGAAGGRAASTEPLPTVTVLAGGPPATGPRVELIAADQAPLLARPFYAGGDPGPIAKALAQVPEMLEVTLPFVGTVLGPSSLPARTKEIVILRTSAVLECRYCVQAHTVVARDTGLSVEEVGALRGAVAIDDAFADPLERAVIAWTDAVAGGRGAVDDGIATAIATHLPEHQVVELTLLVGTTMLLNRFCTALELPSSPETLARLADEGLL